MSAHPPPVPLSLTELTDWRTTKLNRLVVRLVTALASNDPQGLVDVIRTFVRYFKALLEALQRLFIRQSDPSAQGIPFVWIYPATLKKLP